LRILVLGNDPALFASEREPFAEVRERQAYYAQVLRRRWPDGELRIVSFGPRTWPARGVRVADGLKLFSTRSYHRVTFRAGLVRAIGSALGGGWRPDVVTVQKPWEEGTAGWLVARATRAEFLPQVHFDLFAEAWLRERPLNRLRRRVSISLLRRAERIRVVSRGVADSLAETGIARERIHWIPIGVTLRATSLSRQECKRRIDPQWSDRPLVLFVGRLYAPKNLPLWVDVAARIIETTPGVCFAIVGDGPLRSQMAQRVRSIGLENRFRFLGAVRHDRLPELYGAADVFLLTSDHEAFGRVIVEAAQAGVPVVATACTGPRELIEPGATGLLAPRGDGAALAESVSELLRDPVLASRLAGAAREQIGRRFSLESTAASLVDFWEGR
jgi:glycosyltransferase involved in cell wall biosynthesis